MFDDCMILSMRFPQKLWRIVNECKTGAIRWNINGTTILLDYKKFQSEYLDSGHSIFKTKNITSFIRQLNLYGFRKVTSHNRDPMCNATNPDVHEFLHDNFRVGRPDLLSIVYRKTGGKSKCYHKVSKRPKYDVPEKKATPMSRLQSCQMALTRALEQIARDYQEKSRKNCCSDKKDECAKYRNVVERSDLQREQVTLNTYADLNDKSIMDCNVFRNFLEKNGDPIGNKHYHSCCVTR